jgi:anaerobic magnesium-protoporphyrin IX monomethyl ester cyclase
MKTLLIVPPFYRLLGGHNNWVILGPAYLGAVLDKHGHDVKIYNTDHVPNARDLNLREVFEGNRVYHSIMSDPGHPLWAEIIQRVQEYEPDLVGISINFTMIAKATSKIAGMIKKWNPKVKIVVGGPHATIAPGETLSDPNVDYLVRREGEYAMLELVQGNPAEGIPGLSYRSVDGRIRHNEERPLIENLDEIPFPKMSLQLIPITNPGENFGVIATSRGCPFACIFCTSPRLWDRRVRYRSVENVIQEIQDRLIRHGVSKYYFNDDNFNLDRKRTIRLCEGMIKARLEISWICEGQISAFTPEVLAAMKAAGCKRIKLGVESGNDRILKLMRKGTTKALIRKIVRMIRDAGIDYNIYALIGMPTETREEMLETYRFIEELDPSYISLSVASPHYGTELFEMMRAYNIPFTKEDWLEHFHQSYRTILNPNVDENIINHFLTFNDKKGFLRTI